MSNPSPDPAPTARPDATQDHAAPPTADLSANSTNPSFGSLPGAGGPEFPFLSPPQAPDEIGRLGDYRVLKKLGEGGMGFVFRGEEGALQRLVALKVMRPEVAAKPNAADRFLREGRAAAKLKSDHIITIYRADTANGVPYLAMEFLEGLPLDAWLRAQKKAVPLPHALRIVRDTLRGLAAAHEKGLIHRDIKPANLWIEKGTNRIKILDFGLTRGNAGDDQLTQEGAVVGTPAYMAPEQAAGEPVDPRADLFSVGVVFYHLLAGKNPFARGNMMQTLRAIGFEAQVPVTDFRGDVPKAYADFLDRLLAKNPNNRPTNAKVALAELIAVEKGQADANKTAPPLVAVPAADAAPPVWGDLTAEEGVQVHTTRVEHAKPAGPRKPANKKLLLGGGALAALLVVAGAVFVLTKKKTDPAGAVAGPPDGKPVAKVEPKKADPKKPPTVDGDRKAAEYGLARGWSVHLHDVGEVKAVAQLPAGPFQVRAVHAINVSDADLHLLHDLAAVESLVLEGGVTDAGIAKLAGGRFDETLASLNVKSPDLTDAAFPTLTKFRSLNQLFLVVGPKVTGSGLRHLKGLPIIYLHLQGCGNLDDHLAALNDLPQLTSLGLRGAPITDAGLKRIGELTALTRLGLEDLPAMTDAGASHLTNLTNLTDVGIVRVPFTAVGFAAFAKLPKLKTLTANFPSPDDAVAPLARSQSIETLDVKYSAVTDATLRAFVPFKSLKTLLVQQTKVTADGVAAFRMARPDVTVTSDFDGVADRAAAEFVLSRGGTVVTNHNRFLTIAQAKDLPPAPFELTQVSLQKNGFSDADLDAFRSLRSLEVLDTHHAKITDAGLEKVAGFPFASKLTALFLRSNDLTDNAFRAVAKFPALTHLAIGGSVNITGSGLAHLAGMGIAYLNIDGCDRLAEAELTHLQGLPKLTQVTLIISPITDAGLKHVAALKGLINLQLVRCPNVTDAGIKHVEGMAGLIGLELDTTGITPAALQSVARMKGLVTFKGYSGEPGNATLTDADLAPLAGAAALEQLNVSLAAVTDAGLETLARVKTLKSLNLKGSKVTADGVKKLRAALPECKVSSDFGEKN